MITKFGPKMAKISRAYTINSNTKMIELIAFNSFVDNAMKYGAEISKNKDSLCIDLPDSSFCIKSVSVRTKNGSVLNINCNNQTVKNKKLILNEEINTDDIVACEVTFDVPGHRSRMTIISWEFSLTSYLENTTEI